MATMIDRTCSNPQCGKSFEARQSDVNRGWGLYCSKQCKARSDRGCDPSPTPEEAPMPQPEQRTNWRQLDSGHYLVRTQAGYKQALKHWIRAMDWEGELKCREFRGYPKSYPSVVSFSWDYHRSNERRAHSTPLASYASNLRASLADLEPDLPPRKPVDHDHKWSREIHGPLVRLFDALQRNATNDKLPRLMTFEHSDGNTFELRCFPGKGGHMLVDGYHYYDTEAGTNVFHVRYAGGRFSMPRAIGFDWEVIFQDRGEGSIVNEQREFNRGFVSYHATANEVFNRIADALPVSA